MSNSIEVRWGWLQERLNQDPAWIGRQGGRVVVGLLLLALASLLWLPFLGLVLLASALVALGLVVLSDFAVRAQSGLDPRLATLLLLTGIGTWLVLGVRLLWG
jgi:hypothetical protein